MNQILYFVKKLQAYAGKILIYQSYWNARHRFARRIRIGYF